ncbi:MAG: beta-propeller domain-containing protein [Candidatus Bathyarchaeota archaeon]|nr:beta-propeller domain-containing protein [Candidatus Bathyarchaeota archaeon]
MLQQEVQKRTKIYGLVAILSAVLLISMIYVVASPIQISPNVASLKTFSSSDEIKNYIVANTEFSSSSVYPGGPLDQQLINEINATSPIPTSSPSTNPIDSSTQIQFAGVDEADNMKTDGTYLYFSVQNIIYILDADPQNATVLSKIELNNTSYAAGLFLDQASCRLIVIGSQYDDPFSEDVPTPYGGEVGDSIYQHIIQNARTFVKVYDITNKSVPQLTKNFAISGSYFNSRMVGNYLYTVVSQQAKVSNDTVDLPTIYNGAQSYTISPENIYYIDQSGSYFTYTSFIGLDISNGTPNVSTVTMLMGETSNMYVSQNNMYVTFPSPDQDEQGTVIYRISIKGTSLAFEDKGKVPGYILNQYSMDEYNGYFRIATCITTGSWINQEQQNSLYILNSNLTTVGKIENLEINERIYTVRFVEDKCYFITYKQTEPFYIVDLSKPADPKIAGQIKIPAYTSYLYPYDENYVIGIGKQNSGFKLSLFNITDLNKPVELSYFVFGNGSNTPALYDPHAFLFNPENGMLTIPVFINKIVAPSIPGSADLPAYSWQGAYVFNVTVKNGVVFKGTITQIDANSTNVHDYYTLLSNKAITSTAYINQTVYTISKSMVQLNNLSGNFTVIDRVNLP